MLQGGLAPLPPVRPPALLRPAGAAAQNCSDCVSNLSPLQAAPAAAILSHRSTVVQLRRGHQARQTSAAKQAPAPPKRTR